MEGDDAARICVWQDGNNPPTNEEWMQNACSEAENMLRAVGLCFDTEKVTPGGTRVRRVFQLEEPEAYRKFHLVKNDGEEGERQEHKYIHFEAKEGAVGLCYVEYTAGVELNISDISMRGKVLGTSGKRGRESAYPTVHDIKSFMIGDLFAGQGYFYDPEKQDSTGKKDTSPRAFMAPLGALMVSIEFHPTEKAQFADRERMYPKVVSYRVDAVYCTSFGATLEVRSALLLVHVPVPCSSVPCSCFMFLFHVPVSVTRGPCLGQ